MLTVGEKINIGVLGNEYWRQILDLKLMWTDLMERSVSSRKVTSSLSDFWEGGRIDMESMGSLEVILTSGRASPYALFGRKGICLKQMESEICTEMGASTIY